MIDITIPLDSVPLSSVVNTNGIYTATVNVDIASMITAQQDVIAALNSQMTDLQTQIDRATATIASLQSI